MEREKIAITVAAQARLARESAKLDMREEQALADERYAADSEWPAYRAERSEAG